MENNKSTKEFVIGIFSLIFVLSLLLLFINGCEQNDSIVDSGENAAMNESFKKIAEEDEVIQSFEPNFSESEAMEYLGKTSTVIYPAFVWQKVESVNFDLAMTVVGDTAYGVSTKTFTGTLYIAGAYADSTDSDSTDGDDEDFDDDHKSRVDTVIQKPFTVMVTRNIIFEKIDTTGEIKKDWKILAVSLPEGGTGSPNISIKKLTLTLATGDTVIVTSPNEYYVSRDTDKKWGYKGNYGPGGYWKHGHHGYRFGFGFAFLSQFFSYRFNEPVKLKLEVESAYEDEEYSAVTFGGSKYRNHKYKNRLELVSSEFNGVTYNKVYEGKFKHKLWKGYFHAVINLVPYHVVNDDGTPVEAVSWGIPYKVE